MLHTVLLPVTHPDHDVDSHDLHGLAARLQCCLEELHNIMGDNIPEPVLTETVVRHNFNIESSLNELLSLKGELAFLKWVITILTMRWQQWFVFV